MGLYIYQNPISNEIKEIFQTMSEKHEYYENGIKWDRVWTKPNSSIDSIIDPFDHKKGIEKIGKTKGTIGDMQSFSGEQSKRREEKLGSDPLKKEVYRKYKETRGKEHPQEKAEKRKDAKKLTKESVKKVLNKIL